MVEVLIGLLTAAVAIAGSVIAARATLRGTRETNEIAARSAAVDEVDKANRVLTGLNTTLAATVATQQLQITQLVNDHAACEVRNTVLEGRLNALSADFDIYKETHP